MVIAPASELLASVPAIWFRDNCDCELCRDPQSHQKLFGIADLPEQLSIVDFAFVGDGFVITFDDGHRCEFSNQWFAEQSSPRDNHGRNEDDKQLWSAFDVASATQRVDWPAYRDDDRSRLDFLRGIERVGFALLGGTPTKERTVIDIARTFGFVRETNYGELFDVRVEVNPNNLAFTGAAIAPHTDNPYRDPVPTMQLLHCLSNDVEGGESGVVDGFQAAATLREERPHHFEVLATSPVKFAWGDSSNYLSAERPMIELDARSRIRGLRFNNRSLQTLRLESDRLRDFYDAYRYFARILARPELMLTFRLAPGDCLIFDNTRILHARTAFEESGSGRRHLQGCYADLDGLASTVAVLDAATGPNSAGT